MVGLSVKAFLDLGSGVTMSSKSKLNLERFVWGKNTSYKGSLFRH